MLGISLYELIVIILLMVIFINPKDIPSVIKNIAKCIKKLKSFINDIQKEIKDITKEIEETRENTYETFHDQIEKIRLEISKDINEEYYEEENKKTPQLKINEKNE